jgi:hypothetical protein
VASQWRARRIIKASYRRTFRTSASLLAAPPPPVVPELPEIASEAATETSSTFPSFDHHDQNRRRNEHNCRGISVTASVLITKYRSPPSRPRFQSTTEPVGEAEASRSAREL